MRATSFKRTMATDGWPGPVFAAPPSANSSPIAVTEFTIAGLDARLAVLPPSDSPPPDVVPPPAALPPPAEETPSPLAAPTTVDSEGAAAATGSAPVALRLAATVGGAMIVLDAAGVVDRAALVGRNMPLRCAAVAGGRLGRITFTTMS